MPRYDYECEDCQKYSERLLPLAQSDEPQHCNFCGKLMKKVFLTAPAGYVHAPVHYRCPKTGIPITSRKAHEENLAKHNCRVLEPGETKDVTRARERADAELDAAVEKTVEEEIGKMSGDKREALATALAGGADVEVTRGNT